jgi:hypothetical protein
MRYILCICVLVSGCASTPSRSRWEVSFSVGYEQKISPTETVKVEFKTGRALTGGDIKHSAED